MLVVVKALAPERAVAKRASEIIMSCGYVMDDESCAFLRTHFCLHV